MAKEISNLQFADDMYRLLVIRVELDAMCKKYNNAEYNIKLENNDGGICGQLTSAVASLECILQEYTRITDLMSQHKDIEVENELF